MRRLAPSVVVLALCVTGVFVAEPPPVEKPQVKLNGHTFTLPEGFEIELVAGPPLVERPIVADFDEQGRLFVADSSGSNEKTDVQLQKKPHRIVRLEDTRGDGKFDKAVTYADGMMFPEGVRWHAGSLYVAAPPSIWKLTDTNGDGKADQRSEWFQGKTLTGCANDLHGPYNGPDGWIYWCKGAFAKQSYDRPGKAPFVTRAAHIFRCRPDGTGLEPVMTGGMDNPVAVVFTPGGERIFDTTFFQFPGGGKRDGLIHAVYGAVYGKDHDPVHEHKWTGTSLMPVLTHLGPAAPSGLYRYESRTFGPEYQNNLFTALFNMQKVTRHVLVPDGSTFHTEDSDFLVSDNRDFHPTDVLEDADGSLLVIDTGGWYKLCCPTSQLGKPDVLGGIYRIRRKGAPKVEDPRGLKLAWKKLSGTELAALLGDARPAVRCRAISVLGGKGPSVVPTLEDVIRSTRPAEDRRNSVWAATRIDNAAARAAARLALADKDETVRQAAAHSAGLWRDHDAVSPLLKLLRGTSPQNQRAAAEALGRIGDKAAVPPLFESLGLPTDRFLEHSLTYALIEIADRESTAQGLKSVNPQVRRAALIALDQMDGSELKPETVVPELRAKEPAIKEAAAWIVGRHPEWGDALAGYLRDQLATRERTAAERDELVRQLATFARSAAVQELLAGKLRDGAAGRDACQIALRAMAQAGLKEVPEPWTAGLTALLAAGDADLTRDAVATARALPFGKQRPEKLIAELNRIGQDPKTADPVRLTALAAIPGGLSETSVALFDFLRARLDAEQSVPIRTLATDVLSRARLSPEQLTALADALKSAGPLEVERLLEAFGQTTDDAIGRRVLTALKASPVRTSLRVDVLKQRLMKFGPAVQKEAEELYASLNVDGEKQKARLDQLLKTLEGGDVRRGQSVFNSTKAACSSCHAIGYLGGNVGPDLTRVGSIRTERDLLEAIVYPSASFVRGYEPVVVYLKDGKSHNGLIRKDTPEDVLLVTGANQEMRISRTEIEEIQPSKVSVMPAGLDQVLTARELADLVTFLRACK